MTGGFLPHLADLGVAVGLAAVAAVMLGMGRLVAGRTLAPETALIAGWGALCLILTLWGTIWAAPLTIPTVIFAATSILGLGTRPAALTDRVDPAILTIGPRTSTTRQTGLEVPDVCGASSNGLPTRQAKLAFSTSGLWRAALLTLPLWIIMIPARPSQVDTWLNLLPNLAALVDHAAFPRDGGPPSWSFLPAAPYNTQFVGFAVSLLTRSLAANALGLFNVLLLCAAGLHLARVVAPPCQPTATALPWWACAAGFLAAVPLNPGFTPRVFFASYGEAPLAVTLMFSVALGADLFDAQMAGASLAGTLAALALVLAALVEIKQSSLGLLLPFILCLLALGLAAPGMPRRRWCASIAVIATPALLLYGLWRWFVLGHFAVGELKMLPPAEWHLALLPAIVAGIAFAIFQKAAYFTAIALLLGAAVLEARRRPWQRAAIVLALGAGLVAGFNAFLLFTYVAHFPANWAVHAHSYYRYMSQLSLVVVLGLTTCLRPIAAGWLSARGPVPRRRIAHATMAATLLSPMVAAPLLRFDLDTPQPLLWDIGHRAAGLLRETDRVALVVPGDVDDAVGSLLRGVLLFTAPRHPHLDFRSELEATPAALEDAHAAGFSRAIITCAPAGLGGVPPGSSGLIAWDTGGWHPLAIWPLPPGLAHARFSAMLPHAPFCR